MEKILTGLLERGCSEVISISENDALLVVEKQGLSFFYPHGDGERVVERVSEETDTMLENIAKHPETHAMLKNYFSETERATLYISQADFDEDCLTLPGWMPFTDTKQDFLLPMIMLVDKRFSDGPIIIYGGFDLVEWFALSGPDPDEFLKAMLTIRADLCHNIGKTLENTGSIGEIPDHEVIWRPFISSITGPNIHEKVQELATIILGGIGNVYSIEAAGANMHWRVSPSEDGTPKFHEFLQKLSVLFEQAADGGVLVRSLETSPEGSQKMVFYGFDIKNGEYRAQPVEELMALCLPTEELRDEVLSDPKVGFGQYNPTVVN